jgi:hypothetical protein
LNFRLRAIGALSESQDREIASGSGEQRHGGETQNANHVRVPPWIAPTLRRDHAPIRKDRQLAGYALRRGLPRSRASPSAIAGLDRATAVREMTRSARERGL